MSDLSRAMKWLQNAAEESRYGQVGLRCTVHDHRIVDIVQIVESSTKTLEKPDQFTIDFPASLQWLKRNVADPHHCEVGLRFLLCRGRIDRIVKILETRVPASESERGHHESRR